MAKVVFSSEQQRLTGEAVAEVAATNYQDLIKELLARYSRLDPAEMREMAIAIDGVIVHDPLLEQFDKGSELHFFHFIAGG